MLVVKTGIEVLRQKSKKRGPQIQGSRELLLAHLASVSGGIGWPHGPLVCLGLEEIGEFAVGRGPHKNISPAKYGATFEMAHSRRGGPRWAAVITRLACANTFTVMWRSAITGSGLRAPRRPLRSPFPLVTRAGALCSARRWALNCAARGQGRPVFPSGAHLSSWHVDRETKLTFL